jgi:hypothetical protein
MAALLLNCVIGEVPGVSNSSKMCDGFAYGWNMPILKVNIAVTMDGNLGFRVNCSLE